MPVADTDPETAIPDTFQIVPGTQFTFVAAGARLRAPQVQHAVPARARPRTCRLNLPRNLASTASGAVVTGDGVNLDKLGDDTEATNWASLDGVAGKQVTVDLAGDRAAAGEPGQRQRAAAPARSPATSTPGRRTGSARCGRSRSSPATRPSPTAPATPATAGCSPARRTRSRAGRSGRSASQLNLRTFTLHADPGDAPAASRVLASQCTGNPRYAGEQDADPARRDRLRDGQPVRARRSGSRSSRRSPGSGLDQVIDEAVHAESPTTTAAGSSAGPTAA